MKKFLRWWRWTVMCSWTKSKLRHFLIGCPHPTKTTGYDLVYYEGYCPVCYKDICKEGYFSDLLNKTK